MYEDMLLHLRSRRPHELTNSPRIPIRTTAIIVIILRRQLRNQRLSPGRDAVVSVDRKRG
jgi:hypothetical protein